MARYLGGLITKDESLVLPANNYEDTSAPGVWTLEEAQALNKQGLWPTAGVDNPAKFVENIFSTDLFLSDSNDLGSGGVSVTTGIDLANNSGMVWLRMRELGEYIYVNDTVRGVNKALESSTNAAESTNSYKVVTEFSSTGFKGVGHGYGGLDREMCSWTFRKTPKFFDIVTYTGNGSNQNISHNLGATPGFVMVKKTSGTGNWSCWHRSLTSGYYILWNSSNPENDGGAGARTVNDTTYQIFGSFADEGTNGETYVMYLFGHDTSSDGMIQCGEFTTDSSGDYDGLDDLGFQPQWLMVKGYEHSGILTSWIIVDDVRGLSTGSNDQGLLADAAQAEFGQEMFDVGSQGFKVHNLPNSSASGKFIYVAIRKGKMQTPTSSSNVFGINAFTTTSSISTIYDLGIKHDMVIGSGRAGSNVPVVEKRIQSRITGMGKVGGNAQQLLTNSNSTENGRSDFNQAASSKNAVQLDAVMFDNTFITTGIFWAWSNAKGFFDSVSYTGNGSAGRQINHNLGVTPEMIWVKLRDSYTDNWMVYHSGLATNHNLALDRTDATGEYTRVYSPSSTIFTVSSDTSINSNNLTYVAYLFASATGVSKLGSFSHSNGSSTDVDCGFSSGSKFVLVKRKDSTGDWYVWDSTRGIVSGNDPYTLFNTTAAEVTNTDYIDTLSSGFQMASGFTTGDYIFYAIAA